MHGEGMQLSKKFIQEWTLDLNWSDKKNKDKELKRLL